MMGTQTAPDRLFYDFCLADHVPDDHLLRQIDRFLEFDDLRTSLKPYYSHTGRPSIDPELMTRTYDTDADRRLLLRHPLGAAAV